MWAYALNQSRAKIVMDPSYLAVAKRLVRNTDGPSARLQGEIFVSGGPSNVLDQLSIGAFYFRKSEYEYFLEENEYLLGTNLRSFWDWYFRGVVPPCTHCAKETYQCECEHFEDGAPAPVRNPEWWKKITTAMPGDPRLSVDDWAVALLGGRAEARANANAS